MKTTEEIRTMVRHGDLPGALRAMIDRLDAAEETLAIATLEVEKEEVPAAPADEGKPLAPAS